MALRRWQRTALGALGIVIFLFLWHYLSTAKIVNPNVLPPPLIVASTFLGMLSTGILFTDIAISAARIFVGFTLGFLFAVPVGMLAGKSEEVRSFLNPLTQIFQPIPSIAWVPFAILSLGLNNSAAVFVVSLASFFPLLISSMKAVQYFDRDLINVARTLGANNLQVLTKVLLPGIVPDLVSGSRIGIGFAWRAVVAAELIGVPAGIGSQLLTAKNLFRSDEVIVLTLTLGFLMLLFDKFIFEGIEKSILRWKGAESE